MKKNMIIMLLTLGVFAGCSSTQKEIKYTPGQIKDPQKLMDVKRAIWLRDLELQREQAAEKARQDALNIQKLQEQERLKQVKLSKMSDKEYTEYKIKEYREKLAKLNKLVNDTRNKRINKK